LGRSAPAFYEIGQVERLTVAREALERIGALVAIDSEFRRRLAKERRAVLQARASPLLEALHQWFKRTLSKLSRKSLVALAIGRRLTRRKKLQMARKLTDLT